jgi:hypothetical protein
MTADGGLQPMGTTRCMGEDAPKPLLAVRSGFGRGGWKCVIPE